MLILMLGNESYLLEIFFPGLDFQKNTFFKIFFLVVENTSNICDASQNIGSQIYFLFTSLGLTQNLVK